MKELIKDITDYLDDRDLCRSVDEGIREILSRHSAEVEPLAVLADRHGWDLQITGPAFGPQFNHKWEVCMTNPKGQCKTFYDDDCEGAENRCRDDDYEGAENRCRAYLEGLKGEGV